MTSTSAAPRSSGRPTRGSATQASAAAAVVVKGKLKLAGLKRNARRGTATIRVKVSAAGKVTVSGKLVVKQSKPVRKAGVVKLLLKAKGAAKRALNEKGRATLKAKISFAPTGGPTVTKTKKYVLRKLG